MLLLQTQPYEYDPRKVRNHFPFDKSSLLPHKNVATQSKICKNYVLKLLKIMDLLRSLVKTLYIASKTMERFL